MPDNLSPAITVLMTVYNGGEYLVRAIRSVLSQDYSDFEFLIVDDLSTDDSVKTVQKFSDVRIRLIRNDKNMGQTVSLNIGLREAKGAYIARIDADDLALPGWLAAQMAFAVQCPECAVITLPVVLIDPAGWVRKLQPASCGAEEIYLRTLTHSPVNHGGCLMKRDVVLAEGGYDPDLRIAADYGLWSRLIAKGALFAATDHVGMAVRVHGGSISLNSRQRVRDELGRIWRDNISALTDYSVSDGDIDLMWDLFQDLDHCPVERVGKAEDVFETIVRSRRKSLGCSDAVCAQYLCFMRQENALRVKFRLLKDNFFWQIVRALARLWLRVKAVIRVKAWVID